MSGKTGSFDWGVELPRLRGTRLDLRPLRATDAPAIFEIFGDPKVAKYWSSEAMRSIDEAVELLDEIRQYFESRVLFQWGICSRDADEVFGTATIYQLDLVNRRAEIGFALKSACWGQGLATEAVSLLIAFAFDGLKLHRLEADVDPNNAASLHLLEHQGFQREGYLRERWHVHGEVHDSVFLGLLREDRVEVKRG